MKYSAVVGRVFFALAVIGSGFMQLWRQDFVRLVPKVPGWEGAQALWAISSGGVLVAIGGALLFDRQRRLAASLLAALLVLVFLLYIPGVMANPGPGYMWTNPCKTLALLGGAVLLAASAVQAGQVSLQSHALPDGWAWRLCALFYGLFFVVGGIQHYVYIDFVTQLVPAWLPQRRILGWVTGVALVAGGLGINFRPTRHLAATLCGIMVFLWVIMLHIPRAIAMPTEPGELSGVFEALALSGTAFLLAARAKRDA